MGAIVSMVVRARPSCSICGGVSDGMGSFDKGGGGGVFGGHKNNPHVFIPGYGRRGGWCVLRADCFSYD